MSLLDDLEFDRMTDTGMWIWAGILAVVGTGASLLITIWWQRRKDAQKERQRS